MRPTALLSVLLAPLLAACVHTQQPGGTAAYPYQTLLPAEYDARPTDRFPLILFLHGGGGLIPEDHLIPDFAATDPDFPFIVIAPHADDRWTVDRLDAVLEDVSRRFRVDERRMYLTGLSMGAFGAFRLAAEQPTRFAAIALVAGGGEPERACRIADAPVWIFHNRNDEVVPVRYSEELASALRACGAERLRVSIFDAPEPGVWNHNAWRAAYLRPELYQWLLEHAR
jgi:predicted peptidase